MTSLAFPFTRSQSEPQHHHNDVEEGFMESTEWFNTFPGMPAIPRGESPPPGFIDEPATPSLPPDFVGQVRDINLKVRNTFNFITTRREESLYQNQTATLTQMLLAPFLRLHLISRSLVEISVVTSTSIIQSLKRVSH